MKAAWETTTMVDAETGWFEMEQISTLEIFVCVKS